MKFIIALLTLGLIGCDADKVMPKAKPLPIKQVFKQKRQDDKRVKNAFKAQLKAGDCFRYEAYRRAKFSFQKDYQYKDHVYVVMAVDPNRALMIAQPDPDCLEHHSESHRCEYWFRTVTFEDGYLIYGTETMIKCPKELTLDKMKTRLKNSKYYSERYK